MLWVAVIFVFVWALMDLLEKKNKGTFTFRSWLIAVSVPAILSGLFLAAYSWFDNTKIANAPVPDWFGFGLIGLLTGGLFVGSVLERLKYRNVSLSEESVGLAGIVAIFGSFALMDEFDLSGWFLLLFVPVVWITLGGLWSGAVALFVWFAERVSQRKTHRK